MSDTYTKLFGSITASTIWQEPAPTRLVWITMLAMSDKGGCVYASVPGLAHIANVSLQDTEVALTTLLSPDDYSRTKVNEGRRIEPIDGGWRLINHAKFRAVRSAEERREYMREYMREKRAREIVLTEPLAVLADSTGVTPPAPTPTPEEKTEQKKKTPRAVRASVFPLPADFGISQNVEAWAAKNGHCNLRQHLEAFIDVARAKSYAYADWDSAFKKAIRENWAKVGELNGNRTQGRRLSVVERVRAINEEAEDRERRERESGSAAIEGQFRLTGAA